MYAVLLALTLFAGSPSAMPPVPRKSPEFTIVEPSGKQTLLSSYKGKVVVLEFLATWCEHCQHEAQMITKLYKELGPRGFQPIGVALNDNAAVLVAPFVKQFQVPFPVGYAPDPTVRSFLGANNTDRLMVPQVVVIDRKGMIRAQSPMAGDPNLQDEAKVRKLIESLLKEGATKKAAAR